MPISSRHYDRLPFSLLECCPQRTAGASFGRTDILRYTGIGPPKLPISKLTNIFALDVGKMNLRFDDLSDAGSEIESDSSVSDDESMVELSVSVEKVVVSSLETVGAPMDLDVPDPNIFLLLHSLGCNPSNMDCLIQELILFHGNNQICFTCGNKRQGTLVVLLLLCHLDRYEAELSKKNLLLILLLMQSPKNREAARKKLRNAFSEVFLISMKMRSFPLPWISVSSAKKNYEKMDVISTEAMIQEANITTNSARIICQYLQQHFGKSLFAS
jgi:hypothetical protein